MPPRTGDTLGPFAFTYTTDTNTPTPTYDWTVPITAAHTDAKAFTWEPVISATTTSFVTTELLRCELDKLSKKIYEIISEHTKLDISEDEFMNILKETE